MTDQTYPPSADMVSNAHVDAAKYAEMYKASVSDPDTFWATRPASGWTGPSLSPR